MIFVHYSQNGTRRIADLTDILAGTGVVLAGGAPSLKEQPLELLQTRGVTTMAMNNAALHFRPSMWCGVDRPECYDPQIMLDPGIMKFGNICHAEVQLDQRYGSKKFYQFPNMLFYIPEDNVPWDEYLAKRRCVPWFHNTLFTSIHILYHLGVRTIVLAGSDFTVGHNGKMYAHDVRLDNLQVKWNTDLYNSQVAELRRLAPMFKTAGLTLLDSSVHSRISQTYKKVSLEDGVNACLGQFPRQPVDPKTLPHCSKFATTTIQERVAKWPGYTLVETSGLTSPILGEQNA